MESLWIVYGFTHVYSIYGSLSYLNLFDMISLGISMHISYIPLYNMSFKSIMSHIPTGMCKKNKGRSHQNWDINLGDHQMEW